MMVTYYINRLLRTEMEYIIVSMRPRRFYRLKKYIMDMIMAVYF